MTDLKTHISFKNKHLVADLNQPLDISIELASDKNPTAWYLDLPSIEPVINEHFTGSVELGGVVNFRNISFNPHGHGTHTECVGHIDKNVHSINDSLKHFFSVAKLITIHSSTLECDDKWMKKGDLVISKEALLSIDLSEIEALIIRTTPNHSGKLTRAYSDSNPCYMHPDAMEVISASNVKHLLIDMPSVDRESDAGKLAAHHLFWQHPENTRYDRTITEMIYVEDVISDGLYLLELQVAPFKNDASPSRPVLYALKNI